MAIFVEEYLIITITHYDTQENTLESIIEMPIEIQCSICDKSSSILDTFEDNDICIECYFKYVAKVPNHIPDKQRTKWIIHYAKKTT